MSRIVYLDNNATTEVLPEILDAMMPYFRESYGNPSSMHSFGGNVKKAVERAREQVAGLLGADPSEIVFTGGGTESDNTAIQGALTAYPERKGLVTTRVEHPAVLCTCMALAKKGVRVTEIGVNGEGALNLDELERAAATEAALVSIMWANNETGVVFPMQRIAEIVKQRGLLLHTDAVQAAGKIQIDMRKTPVDMLSISGHKLHAPKGVGALYVRKGTRYRSFLLGGHQESGRRAGTENVPSIAGLGMACEMALKDGESRRAKMQALRDRLERELLSRCTDTSVNGGTQERLANTTNISFQYIEGESILLLMDEKGICASSGSACSSGSLEPSHVLRAMGVPFTAVHGSIRFSFSHTNTDSDVDHVLEHLPVIVKRLREISPFGK